MVSGCAERVFLAQRAPYRTTRKPGGRSLTETSVPELGASVFSGCNCVCRRQRCTIDQSRVGDGNMDHLPEEVIAIGPPASRGPGSSVELVRRLSLGDSIAIVVGIMIGRHFPCSEPCGAQLALDAVDHECVDTRGRDLILRCVGVC